MSGGWDRIEKRRNGNTDLTPQSANMFEIEENLSFTCFQVSVKSMSNQGALRINHMAGNNKWKHQPQDMTQFELCAEWAVKSNKKMKIFPIKEMWKWKWRESGGKTKHIDIRYKSVHSFHSPHVGNSCLHVPLRRSHPGTLWPHPCMMLQMLGQFSRAGYELSEGRRCGESVLFLW